MDWQVVAAIGEILGAAGVIASLVYLAGQVRSNAAQVREAAAQTRQAAAQSIISGFNDHLAELADPAQAEFFFPGPAIAPSDWSLTMPLTWELDGKAEPCLILGRVSVRGRIYILEWADPVGLMGKPARRNRTAPFFQAASESLDPSGYA